MFIIPEWAEQSKITSKVQRFYFFFIFFLFFFFFSFLKIYNHNDLFSFSVLCTAIRNPTSVSLIKFLKNKFFTFILFVNRYIIVGFKDIYQFTCSYSIEMHKFKAKEKKSH